MIRAVLIGFAHMHVNEIAAYIAEHPAYTLVGCADLPPAVPEKTAARYTRAWNYDHVRSTFSVPGFTDYRVMLEETKPDIAFVLTENYRKEEVVAECAQRGINVSLEKPMATSYAQACRIRDLAEKHHIEVIVNWPVAWRPYMDDLTAALQSGAIGTLCKLHYINGHTGPLGKGALHRGVTETAQEMTDEERAAVWWYREAEGGGVILDIGCYGSLYANYYLGENPLSVFAHAENLSSPFCPVPDNMSAIVTYPHRYGVLEGTWTTPRNALPGGPVLTGERGVLFVTRNGEGVPTVCGYDLYNHPLILPHVPEQPQKQNIAHAYAHHLATGEPIERMCDLAFNLSVMRLLDGIIRSAQSGTPVSFAS